MPLITGPYSFVQNTLTVSGPNGSFTLGGPDTAAADEGFSWSYAENEQAGGADGSAMNSFNANLRGKLTVRLQKVSPVNKQLSDLFSADRANLGVNWGQNVFTHRDVIRGDLIVGVQGAFTKFPNINVPKIAGTIEWEFDIGQIDASLGPGSPVVAVQ